MLSGPAVQVVWSPSPVPGVESASQAISRRAKRGLFRLCSMRAAKLVKEDCRGASPPCEGTAETAVNRQVIRGGLSTKSPSWSLSILARFGAGSQEGLEGPTQIRTPVDREGPSRRSQEWKWETPLAPPAASVARISSAPASALPNQRPRRDRGQPRSNQTAPTTTPCVCRPRTTTPLRQGPLAASFVDGSDWDGRSPTAGGRIAADSNLSAGPPLKQATRTRASSRICPHAEGASSRAFPLLISRGGEGEQARGEGRGSGLCLGRRRRVVLARPPPVPPHRRVRIAQRAQDRRPWLSPRDGARRSNLPPFSRAGTPSVALSCSTRQAEAAAVPLNRGRLSMLT